MFRITPKTEVLGSLQSTYSFTVKYKWVARICIWLLLKYGYDCIELHDLKGGRL